MIKNISVIIPTYKSPLTLKLCLDSLLIGQVSNDNEIIVVIDGFSTLIEDVIVKYKSKVKFLDLEHNVGLSRAINYGVYTASNEYVFIINDDNVVDVFWDYKLQKYMKYVASMYDRCVISVNQVEPHPSMFAQFNICNLGTNVGEFELSKFWEHCKKINTDVEEHSGSTLPFLMKRLDFISLGGWDFEYGTRGLVADWDFFLKCNLNGYKMLRTYITHVYHFVSQTENSTAEQKAARNEEEKQAHEYSKYKWGNYIKHNPFNNIKTI